MIKTKVWNMLTKLEILKVDLYHIFKIFKVKNKINDPKRVAIDGLVIIGLQKKLSEHEEKKDIVE